jgi:hypothetical protein
MLFGGRVFEKLQDLDEVMRMELCDISGFVRRGRET